MEPRQSHRMPALSLGWMFLRIGATAFGGLGATLALIERELVTKRGILTPADVTEALTYTKLLPGSTGPQAIAYLGYKLGGWSGSALAMAAFLFPLRCSWCCWPPPMWRQPPSRPWVPPSTG